MNSPVPHSPPTTLFCRHCGSHTEHRIPVDDNRLRAVCPACGFIDYDNPKMVVCSIPVFEGKILLCQRAIEPAYGKWTLPGGFMECGESTSAGAVRETWEEACAHVRLIEPVYHIVDIPHIAQTHLFFRGELDAPEFAVGDESLAVRLFAPDEIPWNELVFRSTRLTLRHWLNDAISGVFPTHHSILTPPESDG